MSNYLVDIKDERLSFFTPAGEVKALNNVSIHLKEGEVLGIVGESGSGKSVTAYSLMGLTAYPENWSEAAWSLTVIILSRCLKRKCARSAEMRSQLFSKIQ